MTKERIHFPLCSILKVIQTFIRNSSHKFPPLKMFQPWLLRPRTSSLSPPFSCFPVKNTEGEAWRWVSVQSWKRHHWKTLAGVQQVQCIYDNSQVDLVFLITCWGFSITGKQGRYWACLLSRSVYKFVFRFLYSAFVAVAKPYSEAAANRAISMHGLWAGQLNCAV